jgi:class 3 adenylate cyclase/TolB-like protein
MPEDRRLAAIMFTDIVGYTALMGSDEDKAFEILKINREIHTLQLERYNGTLIKEMGDGILASFPSALRAVQCAIAIQEEANLENIPLRIGIHEGEVVFEGGDILGDGVNVASRLEELAQDGSINISGAVYRNVKNKAGIKTRLIEEKRLKNVDEPVKVYEVICKQENRQEEYNQKEGIRKSTKYLLKYIIVAVSILILAVLIIWQIIPFNKKNELEKTIAVLPIKNLSGDINLEYMCDGLTEEIIYHLILIKDFSKVISSNSVMTLKNSSYTTPEIGQLLNVNYVIDGSYRQSSDQLKINIHLIEAKRDKPVWSDVYDFPIGNLLDIQEIIAINVANSLEIELTESEEINIQKKPTKNIQAYTLLKKAEHLSNHYFKYDEAERLLYDVIKIDSTYSDAYAILACNYLYKASDRGSIVSLEAKSKAQPLINKSIELNPKNVTAYYAQGMLNFWHEWNFIDGELNLVKAIELNPDYVNSYSVLSQLYTNVGRDYSDLVTKMVEIDPLNLWTNMWLTNYYSNKGESEKVLSTLKSNLELFGEMHNQGLVFYYLEKGNKKEATEYFQKYLSYIKSLKRALYPKELFRLIILCRSFGDLCNSNNYFIELVKRCENSSAGSPNFFMAKYYCRFENTENAFEYLERAYLKHETELIWYKVDEDISKLHDDPRYLDLYTRIGFKAYDEYIEKEGLTYSLLE